jgi:Asp-tRNA(Asn)/Glu-tRNA(Gln) amidotransferase A subunit family amidase
MTRVGAAAQSLGVDVGDDTAVMDAAVAAVEEAVELPTWDEAVPYPPWPLPLREHVVAPSEKPLSASAPPRLVADGGPYVAVLGDRPSRQGSGPLAGWTVAVKDIISVAGFPLRASSKQRDDVPPQRSDASVVDGLRRLGASIVGITVMHEFAFGVTGVNAYAGTPANPRSPGSLPGGSSSGSASAVAEGSARLGLGTDTGGSVRIPAALCGVVGYKPSYGLYPIDGVFPLAPSLDHVGLLAATVADLRAVHGALGFPDTATKPPRRVGINEAELEAADTEVAASVGAALRVLERHGAKVTPVSWPARDMTFATSTLIMFSEAAAVHRSGLQSRGADYGDDIRARLLQGSAIQAWAYAAAIRHRAEIRRRTLDVLAEVDCVLGPTVGVMTPTIDDAKSPELAPRLVEFTRLANVAGVPALSIPLPADGPVGLQMTAADDSAVLAMGAGVERLLAEGSG